MSGFEWFFVLLSGGLMMFSFWLRIQEDRAVAVAKYRQQARRRRSRGY